MLALSEQKKWIIETYSKLFKRFSLELTLEEQKMFLWNALAKIDELVRRRKLN